MERNGEDVAVPVAADDDGDVADTREGEGEGGLSRAGEPSRAREGKTEGSSPAANALTQFSSSRESARRTETTFPE